VFFIPDGQYQHSEVEHLTERRKNGGTHCGDNRLIYLNRFCVKTTPTTGNDISIHFGGWFKCLIINIFLKLKNETN